ncbi:ABC transporter B family member 4, partial [Ananas comosus]
MAKVPSEPNCVDGRGTGRTMGGGGRGRGEARSVAEKRSGDGHGDGEGEGEGEGKRGGGGGDQKVPLHRLFAFADAPDVTLMAVGTAAAVANGLAMPLMTFIFGQLIDAFGVANRESVVRSVAKVVLKFVYLAGASGVAAFLQVSCWMVTGERQASRIRRLYLKAILRQDIAFFDNETTTGEVAKFIQLVSTFFGGFIVAFTKGWLLSLVMLSSIPPIVIAGATMSLTISRLSTRGQAAYAEAGNVVEQTVGSIRTVVSFTGEKRAIDKYNKFVNSAYKSAIHEGTAAGMGIGCVLFVVFSSYSLAVWYGSKLIIEKGYNGGAVINVIMAIMTGAMSLGQASPCINAFASGRAAAYKMFETIYRKPEIDAYNENGLVLADIKGEIDLKDIYFSYPARPDQLIFDGFSLHVSSGTTMALVGESGSGKSTVISLVERFYDPQAGEVLIDGVNLKELKLTWIREKIGLVSQEPILFTTTIKENIEYGKEGATMDEIRRAMELANAAKFVDKLPNGLNTMVGEHGTQLSGGQKQRIAIARAILKNPRILLLDEATSALDAESERIVQDALVKIMVDRTTIVIAHRLTTVKNADKISVVQRGKLIEQGSHAELIMNPDGAYSQLIRLQEVNSGKEEAATVGLGKQTSTSSVGRSYSRNLSFERSISRGSSVGRSSRRSFTINLGIPAAVEYLTDQPIGDEVGGGEHNCSDKEKSKATGLSEYARDPNSSFRIIAAAVGGVILLCLCLDFKCIKTFYEPPQQLRKDARFWALMYVLLGVISFITVPVQHFLFGLAGGKLIERIRSLSFKKVVYQEISWFDDPENSSGAIGASYQQMLRQSKVLWGFLGIDGSKLGYCYCRSCMPCLQLEASTLVLVILLNGSTRICPDEISQGIQFRCQVYIINLMQKMYEEASQVANDAVGSIRTVASFCAERKVMSIYAEKCDAPMQQGVRQGVISGLGYGFSYLLLYCTYALCFYV